MAGGKLERDLWLSRAGQIKRALLDKRWTCVKLAREAGYGVRVIHNILHSKPVRILTYLEICEALGLKPILEPEIEPILRPENEVADEAHGGYSRSSSQDYEGAYFGYRRSLTHPDEFIRSVFTIRWNQEKRLLEFNEYHEFLDRAGRPVNFSQDGEIYVSAKIGLVHMVTVTQGAVRLVTLSKMDDETMRGCVLTQRKRPGFYQPSVSAIYLHRLGGCDPGAHKDKIGPIRLGDRDYEGVEKEIGRVERDFVLIALPKAAP